eukprot:2502799-Rhodomonas_salina.3
MLSMVRSMMRSRTSWLVYVVTLITIPGWHVEAQVNTFDPPMACLIESQRDNAMARAAYAVAIEPTWSGAQWQFYPRVRDRIIGSHISIRSTTGMTSSDRVFCTQFTENPSVIDYWAYFRDVHPNLICYDRSVVQVSEIILYEMFFLNPLFSDNPHLSKFYIVRPSWWTSGTQNNYVAVDRLVSIGCECGYTLKAVRAYYKSWWRTYYECIPTGIHYENACPPGWKVHTVNGVSSPFKCSECTAGTYNSNPWAVTCQSCACDTGKFHDGCSRQTGSTCVSCQDCAQVFPGRAIDDWTHCTMNANYDWNLCRDVVRTVNNC